MKKSILNLKGAQELSKNEQKNVHGSTKLWDGACCCENSQIVLNGFGPNGCRKACANVGSIPRSC